MALKHLVEMLTSYSPAKLGLLGILAPSTLLNLLYLIQVFLMVDHNSLLEVVQGLPLNLWIGTGTGTSCFVLAIARMQMSDCCTLLQSTGMD